MFSAFVHVAVLHLQVGRPAAASPAGPVATDRPGAPLEVVQIRIPEDVAAVEVETAPTDPTHIEPTTAAPSVEATTDLPVQRRTYQRPFDPAGSDARLWPGKTEEWSAPLESTRSAEAISDSAVLQWNASGMRIGPLRVGLKSCDSFLTCRLDFVQASDLGERFSRMREIEGQAALSALYRERLEALRIRRRNKSPN